MDLGAPLHFVERVLDGLLVLEGGQSGYLAQRSVGECGLIDRLLLRQYGQLSRVHHPGGATRTRDTIVANATATRRGHPERL